jgi:glycerol-3-phosphate acyltransferase PlsY
MVLCIALIVIVLTRRVSAGALVASAAFPFIMNSMYPPYFAPALLIALIIWIKHRQNIGRILRGEEPGLEFGKSGSK